MGGWKVSGSLLHSLQFTLTQLLPACHFGKFTRFAKNEQKINLSVKTQVGTFVVVDVRAFNLLFDSWLLLVVLIHQ